jgi:Butirosin biosynthesis protein H, N-terminal/Domain of unknown function (DUF4872)
MTRHREFKTLVRERMAKTGERYTAARAQLLPPDRSHTFPGLFSGYDRVGGVHGDTGAVSNVLRHAGITSPLTGAPYTEAMVNGLCGGPGFLYAVFEYKGWPPMLTLALRSRSMNDAFINEGLARLGAAFAVSETSSRPAAAKALEALLSAGTPALCTVDMASLSYYGLPELYRGGAPHVIAVVGRDRDHVWVDDRSTRPFRVAGIELAEARARYRAGKQRLVSVVGPKRAHDARAAIREAIAATARRYVEPAVPKSFWVNCGFSGLDKWAVQLTDVKDKKGWPSTFTDTARAYAGLQRAYECIEGTSGPAGGRALYADFLEEASAATGNAALRRAATAFRESAALWAEGAARIAGCDDAAVRQACEISDRRVELGDAHGDGISRESKELWEKRHQLGEQCRLGKDAALALYAGLSKVVVRIAAAERKAVELLKGSA